jgi:hypothetical protein
MMKITCVYSEQKNETQSNWWIRPDSFSKAGSISCNPKSRIATTAYRIEVWEIARLKAEVGKGIDLWWRRVPDPIT